jgi:hypothetical protein
MSKYFITIPELPSMTPQEVFDKAARHVLANGEPSVDPTGSCVYSGIGCAAAPFIKPEFREEAAGSWYSLHLPSQGKWEHSHRPDAHVELIGHLQGAHDHSANLPAFISEFKKEMVKVAERYSLSTAVLGC